MPGGFVHVLYNNWLQVNPRKGKYVHTKLDQLDNSEILRSYSFKATDFKYPNCSGR